MPSNNSLTPVSSLLTNFAVSYRPSIGLFMAEKVFPRQKVNSDNGTYLKMAQDALFGDNEDIPSGSDGAVGFTGQFQDIGDYELTTGTFKAEYFRFKIQIHEDEKRKERDLPILKLQQNKTIRLMYRMLLGRETRVKNIVTSTSNITNNTTLSGNDQWSAFSTSDPINDMRTAVDTVKKKSMVYEQALYDIVALIPYEVYSVLQFHPAILDLLPANADKYAVESVLKKFFRVDEVIVPEVLWNNAIPAATVSQAYLWGKDVLVYLRPKGAASEDGAHFGNIMEYNPFKTLTWREEPNIDWVGMEHASIEELCAESSAYLIKTAVA